MPESRTDHDALILMEGRVNNIEKRINGHVPDRCIRTDEMLQQIVKDINEMKASKTWLWQAAGSAIIAAVVGLLFSKIGG